MAQWSIAAFGFERMDLIVGEHAGDLIGVACCKALAEHRSCFQQQRPSRAVGKNNKRCGKPSDLLMISLDNYKERACMKLFLLSTASRGLALGTQLQ